MSKANISITRTLFTLPGGYRVVQGWSDKGIHATDERIMLVTPSGSQCKSAPVTVDSPPAPTDAYRAPEVVAELAAEKASRKARKARKGKAAKVVVEQTASPAPSKTASMPVQEKGETWRPFAGRCKTAGFTWTEASAAYVKPSASYIANPPPAGDRIVADPIPSDADGAADTDTRVTRRQARKLAQASLHSEATSLSDTVKRNSKALEEQSAIMAAIAAKLGV